MTLASEKSNRIALLATGDEITNGDILNSNAQQIAQKIFNTGMSVGTHMTVADNTTHIENAIHFLLEQHNALVITGGLGPTSDDLTRFALSNALQRPLVFDETIWDAIVARLKKFGYANPPASNRQQALFPEGSTIYPNPNGTAAGCMLEHNGKWIFMLPGPPFECMPMVDDMVLPTLKKAGFPHVFYHNRWYLFGVSEGQIAEELDALAKPFDCTTGYRISFPYIEFKFFCKEASAFAELTQQIEARIAPYLIGDGKKIASTILREKIIATRKLISIDDSATHGLLETTLSTPETADFLDFKHPQADIKISGLTEYWQQVKTEQTKIAIEFAGKEKFSTEIRLRDERTKLYAMEWICKKILDNYISYY